MPHFFSTPRGDLDTFHAEIRGEAFFKIAPDSRPVKFVRLEGLLSDRVARLNGLEISRADVLKYICHHDYGVHYRGKPNAAYRAIDRFRYALTFSLQEDGQLKITRQDLDKPAPRGAMMDLAQAHTSSTAFFLVRAPDVQGLLRAIEPEIAGH